MKRFLVLMLFLILGMSCSSQKTANREVEKEAQAVQPELDPRAQYARAISMIRSTKDLNDDQKNKLVTVINTYAMKSMEARMLQSQYRAVLVTEMLNSGSQKNPKVDAAKKKLQKLDAQNSKDLGTFIRDFKFYSNNNVSQRVPMREIIRIQ